MERKRKIHAAKSLTTLHENSFDKNKFVRSVSSQSDSNINETDSVYSNVSSDNDDSLFDENSVNTELEYATSVNSLDAANYGSKKKSSVVSFNFDRQKIQRQIKRLSSKQNPQKKSINKV